VSDTRVRLPGYRAIVAQIRIEIGTMLGHLITDHDLANRLHNTLTAYGAFQSLMLVLHETEVPVEDRAGILRRLRSSAKYVDSRPRNHEIINYIDEAIHNLHMEWEEEAPIPLDYVPKMVDDQPDPRQCNVPVVDLNNVEIDKRATALVSFDICMRHALIPITLTGQTLTVAMSDTSNIFAVDDIKALTGLTIDSVMACEADIMIAIAEHYITRVSAESGSSDDDAAKQPPADATEEERAEWFLKRYGTPTIDLSKYDINPKVAKLVPAELCEKHRFVPLSQCGSILIIVVADPSNIFMLDDVKFITGLNIEMVVAQKLQIDEAIERYYPKAGCDLQSFPDTQQVPDDLGDLQCSFCGRGQEQIKKLIAGPHAVYICDECVLLCNDILAPMPGSGT